MEGALPGGKGVSLKAGRQELAYGGAFLLGADTFCDGLTFDAAKLSWKPTEKLSLDLFGGRYVKKWAGGIDVTNKLNVSLNGHNFRADKVPAGFNKEIGLETNLIFTCRIDHRLSVLLSGNRFFTGDFFKEASGSGKDISYVYLQAQATF